VVITQLQPITVIFTIPEDSLAPVQAQLRQNKKLAVDIYDRSAQNKLATGELLALDNQIDTTTGTLKLRAIFDNKDYALFPNQFVNVRLLVQTLEGVTLVPTPDIQQNGDSSFVYVIQNGVAHQRDIKVGVTDSDAGVTQVTGVNPGDILADSSFDKITDNAKVTLGGGPGGGPGRAGGGGRSAEAGASPRAHHSPHPSDD